MRCFCLILLSILMSMEVVAWGQELSDSIPHQSEPGLSAEDILELTQPLDPTSASGTTSFSPVDAIEIERTPVLDARYAYAPSITYDIFPRGSYLPRWARGGIYGYNSHSASLLYGYTANAGIGVYQQLGDYWTVNAAVDLNKYSVYYITASIQGAVTWRPSDIFSVTAFGSYMPGSFLSPVNVGTSFQYGGYISLQTRTDVPFGIDLGATESYDSFSGHELTLIVRPYVMLGGSKLGIDVGGFLKGLNDKHPGHKEGQFNPIPQPIKNLPAVAPRR